MVWAQMVRERRVLLQVRQPRECFVGSQAFVVLLDATRASARCEEGGPLVVMVQKVWVMVLLPQEPQVCWAWTELLGWKPS